MISSHNRGMRVHVVGHREQLLVSLFELLALLLVTEVREDAAQLLAVQSFIHYVKEALHHELFLKYCCSK